MKIPFVSFRPMERAWYIEGIEDESFEKSFAEYCCALLTAKIV